MPLAKVGTNGTTISLLTFLLALVFAICPASAFLRWQPTRSAVASHLQQQQQQQHRSPFLPPSSISMSVDDDETEGERLRLDAEARERMAEHVARVQAAQEQSGGADGQEHVDRAPWKWGVRQRVWDMMEAKNIAEPPRPVHHRIPNFKGAKDAAERLVALPEFLSANCIKCNPDTPQNQVRFLTMEAGKLLLVPQPRLRTGFFSLLDPGLIHTTERLFAATSAGVKKHGAPLSLSSTLPRVDLIVVGSVAVDPVTGARIGKGEGFAELEYGMLRQLGVIDKDTPVVTTVRDEQVISDLVPTDAKVLRHDVPVDIIVTPTRVLRTEASRHIEKPTGIYWDLLSPEKLGAIKVLQVGREERGRAGGGDNV
jgi:5-formyltetrahydrofolate cyclo-ligase